MRGAGNRRRGPGGARTKLGVGDEGERSRASGRRGVLLASRRGRCATPVGLWRSGALRPRRRRELCSALSAEAAAARVCGGWGVGIRVPGGSNLRKSAADLGVSAKGGHPEDRGGGLGCGRCAEGKRREIAPTCGPGVAERVGARGRSGLVQEETGPLCARQAERGRASAGGWAARLERKRRSGRYWAGAVAG